MSTALAFEPCLSRSTSLRRLSLTIFLVSAVGLFVEMILIRWIGTEVRIFAYLQNTVLIVCFLGLGTGCFTSKRPIHLWRSLLALVILSAVLSLNVLRGYAASITDLLGVLGDLVIWDQSSQVGPWSAAGSAALGLLLTFGVMVLLWEVFVPLGRILGRSMDQHPRTIWAYSVNVAGSLVGIWLFVLFSALQTPPVVWLGAAAVLFVWFGWFAGQGKERVRNLGLLGLAVVVSCFAGKEPAAREVAWSPYQKLSFGELEANEHWRDTNVIMVNNTGYQALFDLSDASVRANPRIEPDARGLSQYDIPLLLKPNPEHVLIVGAGSGNDVAGALRGGARRVTAVEIDPAIIDMGRRHHPEEPYASPNVRVVNDDARSFFATTGERFDLIIFGLLDSHTTTAMTNARLDHYVYTRESLSRARSLLTDDGVMALSFEADKPFIADRMSRCIAEVFGRAPLAFQIPPNPTGWGGTMFVAGSRDVIDRQLAANRRLARQIGEWQELYPLQLPHSTKIATDDWPYIYLEKPLIPSLYILLAILMAGLVVYGKLRLKSGGIVPAWKTTHWHFFFLGSGFLLLEVQNISKAAVVLGNTWQVNAVIVSGILVMILLANWLVHRLPRLPILVPGVCLIASCVALYFFDLSSLAFLPFAAKAVLAAVLTALPMLFSGIVFIQSFARVHQRDAALGANLMGALVGGLLQSITFLIGVKALLLVVAALYGMALLLRPKPAKTRQRRPEATRECAPDQSERCDGVGNEGSPELLEVS